MIIESSQNGNGFQRRFEAALNTFLRFRLDVVLLIQKRSAASPIVLFYEGQLSGMWFRYQGLAQNITDIMIILVEPLVYELRKPMTRAILVFSRLQELQNIELVKQ